MIDQCLEALTQAMCDYFVRLPELNGIGTEAIVLGPVAKPDGSLAIPTDTIGCTLVNLEEERVMRAQECVTRLADGSYVALHPELRLNVYLLFSAHFTTYTTGLRNLSAVVRFFQSHPFLSSATTPTLPESVEKLIFELQTLNFDQQNYLWGSLGAKYLPSVLYKMRLLTIQDNQSQGPISPVRSMSVYGPGERP